jgi:3-methyladenine DNA glycosylase/8-oxoguanine DNA glycosylase
MAWSQQAGLTLLASGASSDRKVGHNLADMRNHALLPESQRALPVVPPFDLARTVAPVWWARGRWPNVDWRDRTLTWVGWEEGRIVWRAVRQRHEAALEIVGSGDPARDERWAVGVLGTATVMPAFGAETLRELADTHRGLKPWAAGSLYEGVVSSLIGQSISVAAAAVTERRLYAQFNDEITIDDRGFWVPPRADQLAAAEVSLVRASGVTTKRAEALVEVGRLFADGVLREPDRTMFEGSAVVPELLAVPGIGPWTVRSAYLWGLGDPDAHPSGDVALLRAVRQRLPHVTTLKELDTAAADWTPHRGWAARLFWIDLLGFDEGAAQAP